MGAHLGTLKKEVADVVAQEEACLEDARLLPQVRVHGLAVILGVGFRVEVVHVSVLALGPLGRVGERGEDEALQSRHLGDRVDDVLQLLSLMLGCPDIQGLSGLVLALVGRVTVEAPEVADSEDGMGTLESRRERLRVVDVGSDNLGPALCQSLRLGARGVARQGADLPARFFEECVGDGTTLIAGGSENDDEFRGRHCE